MYLCPAFIFSKAQSIIAKTSSDQVNPANGPYEMKQCLSCRFIQLSCCCYNVGNAPQLSGMLLYGSVWECWWLIWYKPPLRAFELPELIPASPCYTASKTCSDEPTCCRRLRQAVIRTCSYLSCTSDSLPAFSQEGPCLFNMWDGGLNPS